MLQFANGIVVIRAFCHFGRDLKVQIDARISIKNLNVLLDLGL